MEQASVPRWICLSVGPRAAGIGILTVILGILLFIGCWYYRRRSGYRSLKVGKVPTAGILSDPGFCFLLFLCISEEWGNFLKITSSSDFWFWWVFLYIVLFATLSWPLLRIELHPGTWSLLGCTHSKLECVCNWELIVCGAQGKSSCSWSSCTANSSLWDTQGPTSPLGDSHWLCYST